MTILNGIFVAVAVVLVTFGGKWAYGEVCKDIELGEIRKEINRLRWDVESHLRMMDCQCTDRMKFEHATKVLAIHMVCRRAQNGDGFQLTESDQWTAASILRIWQDSAGYFDGSESMRLRYMLPDLHDDGWTHTSPLKWIEAIPDDYRQSDLVVTPIDFRLTTAHHVPS